MKKAITFKQAFVVVICLHAAGYFGVTQISKYRKQLQQAKAERQIKFKQVADENDGGKNDWPAAVTTKITEGKQLLDKTIETVQPLVKDASVAIKATVNQIEKKAKSTNIVIENKKQVPRLVSQPPNANTKVVVATSTTKIRQPATNVSQPTTIQRHTQIVFAPESETIHNSTPITQKIYTVDGVQYIETKKVISSMIAL